MQAQWKVALAVVVCGMTLALGLNGGARGDEQGGAGGAGGADKVSVTTGKWTPAGGEQTQYTAAAGYMPLKDEAGKLRAKIFYVAYTVGGGAGEKPEARSQKPEEKKEDRTGMLSGSPAPQSMAPGVVPATGPATAPAATEPGMGSKRPLMFLFNGGPGAASVWLHLGAVGPKKLDVPADGSAPKAPFSVVDNPDSWLGSADLVFVDPVDTGYSRAADPEKAKEFFGVQEDIAAVAEFIRLYLTKHQRWGSPIYLAGESYGTTRVSGLAPYLQEHNGVSVSGIVLVSAVLNFANISPREGNDLPYPLFLPTYAALRWYHPRSDADEEKAPLETVLKEAEKFALNEYTVALAKGDALPEQDRQAIAKRLSDFTGLSQKTILETNLRIHPERFQKELLREQGKIIGRFDGRITGLPTDPPNDSAEYDPSLDGFFPAYSSAFNDYVRRTLKYENDLTYEVLSGRTRPWNFSQHGEKGGGQGFLYVGNNLRDAMTKNPRLRVLVCSGRFDLATPYFGTDYSVEHLGLAPELRKNVTRKYYPGGHMMYHVKAAAEALGKDVAGFVEGENRNPKTEIRN